MKPIIKKGEDGRWMCITAYTVTTKGTVLAEEMHDITELIQDIVQANAVADAMDAISRRN